MEGNILLDSNISKIILSYSEHGIEHKYTTAIRNMDSKNCYLAILSETDFVLPTKKTKAQLIVYTSAGVYIGNTEILGTKTQNNEIHFQISIPAKYDSIQCRSSERIHTEFPVSIKYDDNFVINSTSYDLSMGGFTFYLKEEIPSAYKKLNPIVKIQFPANLMLDFHHGQLIAETKYLRKLTVADKDLYAFKFVGLQNHDKYALEQYLTSIK